MYESTKIQSLFAAATFTLAALIYAPTGRSQSPSCSENGCCQITVAAEHNPSAVRVVAGNSCGSGWVCGRDGPGSLIMTNAHVVGTRVGRVVTVRAMIDGRTREFAGTVKIAAYSDRYLTDWAIVFAPTLSELPVTRLSKRKPSGSHTTTGSPRCRWPQISTAIATADVSDNSPLWRWRPNAIGGQSGSGVFSTTDNLAYGLLTWSWGGLGAGQQTSEIYRQAARKTTTGPLRLPGLQELSDHPIICESGYFAESGITGLDIWDEHDDDKTPPNIDGLTDDERALITTVRQTSDNRALDISLLIRWIIWIVQNLPTIAGR